MPHGCDARIVMAPHLELFGSSILASHADAIDLTVLVSRIAKKATAPREAKAGAVRVGAADTDRLVAENPWLAAYLGRDGQNHTEGPRAKVRRVDSGADVEVDGQVEPPLAVALATPAASSGDAPPSVPVAALGDEVLDAAWASVQARRA